MSPRLQILAGAALAALVFAPAARITAQAPTLPRDDGAHVERLADGVYAIIHEPATRDWPSGAIDWPHGNTGVIVGDDGVLVVDSDYFPSRAKADIALIRVLTPKPVRWLVNTHWHGDHTHGNAVYRDAFASIEIIGARANAHYISLNQARWPKIATASGSPSRVEVERLEKILADGHDSTGRALGDAERLQLTRSISEKRTELAELASVRVAPPTRLFDHDLTLMLGRRRVVLRNWDRANSPADVTVYLPAEQVLFTGDILVHPVPYAMGSYPGPWVGVLRGVEALPVRALVPGHGDVQHDHAYTRLVRTLFEATAAQLDSLTRAGKNEQDARRMVKIDDFHDRFVKPGDPSAQAYWEYSIKNALIERSYQCVVGYRC